MMTYDLHNIIGSDAGACIHDIDSHCINATNLISKLPTCSSRSVKMCGPVAWSGYCWAQSVDR